MNRHANIQARGMTLVELLVAVAILTVMVAGVGFVFSRTANAVSATQANIDTNANIRATLARLHEDMRMLTKDGFLFVSGPTDDAGAGNEPTPTVLMFTASGHFESQTSSKTANAALIAYMPVKDKFSDAAVLARYVFLLTGESGSRDTLRDILGANPSESKLDDLTDNDCLDMSLTEIKGQVRDGSFLNEFCAPLLNRWASMDTAPATYDGVEDLWPYLAGGLKGMEIDFNDGKYVGGGSVGATDPEEWICLNSNDDSKNARDDRRGDTGVDAAPSGSKQEWIVWDFRCNENWPKALRLRMEFGDVSGRLEQPRDVETVLVLPQ